LINPFSVETDIDVFVERRLNEQTALRLEAHNILDGTERPRRIVFTPNRRDAPAAVSFTEIREVNRGRKAYVSLRRNF
jgi:hypothetical protein